MNPILRRLRAAVTSGAPDRPRGETPVLDARGLTVRRGGRTILDSADLDVGSGELVCLVGPNGAGKSTLLSALSGDAGAHLTAGEVALHGRALHRWTPRELARRRAVLPQHHAVSFPFRVAEIVEMGRAPWAGTPHSREGERVVAESLHAAEVAHLADRRLPTLSGGERARVALARILAQRAGALLLDESTAALDIRHQELVLALARSWARDGGCVVVVLHDLTLAAAYADRVAVVAGARIAAYGAPGEVFTEPLLSEVYEQEVEVVAHPRTGAPLVLPGRVGGAILHFFAGCVGLVALRLRSGQGRRRRACRHGTEHLAVCGPQGGGAPRLQRDGLRDSARGAASSNLKIVQPYPKHWEADVVLSDGGTAHMRPITPQDADALRGFHSRLSPETIYFRFFAPYPKLSDRDVRRFTHVDYADRVALVATIGEDLVAVVRYDRLSDEEAEVAFVVEDGHQGRGLASVLLEHIAAVARERGVHRFIAEVLPENRRMVNVFREAGYTAQQSFDDGVIRLTLDLEPTAGAVSVMHAREQRAESASIARLLAPRSVAVVGARRSGEGIGQAALRNLLDGEPPGPVYPVHPSARAVSGVRAFPTVLDIPDPVDLAVVAVPAESVAEVVEQCARKGVHGLVVVSSGFGEVGAQGRERQEKLVHTARAAGMRVVGPNALGIANTAPDVVLNATLAADLPPRGRVGLFAQSGALGRAILRRLTERGMGLSTFVSAGNRADVSGNDLLQYWQEDPQTEVVLQYLESLGNPRKFTRLARRLARTKPIVVVRSGESGIPAGHAAGSLALPDYAVTSLFHQAGVVRVEDITQMFDVAQLFAHQPLPHGPRVGIVGNSDSLGLLVKNACVRAGLRPREPLDLGPDATAEEFRGALAEALDDEAIDALAVVFFPALHPISGDVAEVVREAAARAAKPIVTTYLGYRGMPEDLRQVDEDGQTARGSVPSYPSPEDAVRALAHATRYAKWRERDPGRHPELEDIDGAAARALIDEAMAQSEETGLTAHSVWFTSEPMHQDDTAADPRLGDALLRCYGIEVWPGRRAASADEAVRGAAELTYPVVVKADAPELRLRAGGSGVRRNLGTPEEVRTAYEGLRERFGDAVPLTVQRMAPPGVPTAIRAGENPSFGSVVGFGLADPTAELLDDRAYRLAPLTDADAADLVRAVRSSPLLFGVPAGATTLAEQPDIDALEGLLIRVSRLVDALPEVAHVELDPVSISPEGAHVLGARVWLQESSNVRLDYGPRRLRDPY